ncbi:MAG: site-2 protease family protein [Leptolyngbyaceae cyanobacterium T60_A2020_046]|nr:site-2 protease family protein [Leptolyngbyaceae cyanobacterium T60_A2020_046]
MITVLLLLVAIALLVWGFVRARPYGKIGIYAWLQSVVLMAPWLLFFGLFATGIYVNLAGVLFLVVVSAGLYIYLGRQLRAMGQDELMAQKMATLATAAEPATGDVEQSPDAEAESQPAQATGEPDAVPTMPAEDLTALEGIFGIDTFFRTETVPYQQGAIFRGNLRGEPEPTLARLKTSATERLGEKYRLFLIQDPGARPVVVALPSSTDPQLMTLGQKVIAILLGIATLATCMEAAGLLMNIELLSSPSQWPQAFPIAAGVIVILIVHELGHWAIARQNGVKLSWPFFLPTWQIGAFGALTRFESVLPNRSVLFDVAFAGPAAGGLLSLAMLFVGLVLSHPGSTFQIPAEFFQGSALVGALAKGVLGNALSEPIVDVHPLTLIGWIGLVITALNLMPAGQLDGGRIVQAIYGRKTAGRTTVVTLILLAIASLANSLALYWAALILFLQRGLERPAENELTEPDDARAALALLALFLTLATLIPLTPSLAGKLGIGS